MAVVSSSEATPSISSGIVMASMTSRDHPVADHKRARMKLRHRVRLAFANAEGLFIRYRTFVGLFAAFSSVMFRTYEEASGSAPIAQWKSSGVDLLDTERIEPLTHSSVLAQSKQSVSAGTTSRKRHTVLRRNAFDIAEAVPDVEDDEIIILERAVKVAGNIVDELHRNNVLVAVHGRLGHLYSTRARYIDSLHAMDAAIGFDNDVGDGQAVLHRQIEFGRLELKHHRYYAAEIRFEDALKSSNALDGASSPQILSGSGWAAMMLGDLERAEKQLLVALERSDVLVQPPVSGTNANDYATLGLCRARHDSIDSDRVVALVGLAMVLARRDSTPIGGGVGFPQELFGCAADIMYTIPASLREPRSWNALGLADQVLGRTNSARIHHLRALQQEWPRPGTLTGSPTDVVDLTSASHSALYTGLVEFGAGNEDFIASYIEQLAQRVDDNSSGEVAEWLIRFARAHAWAPAGREFGAFLLGRATPLLASLGDDRTARHLVEYGRFLYDMNPPQAKQALAQLQQAQDLLKSAELDWPSSDVAMLHSLVATVDQ